MPLSLTGYVLEPIRIGQANSPFTFTPDNFISNQITFDTAYPSSEANPPTQYHVVVMEDGDLPVAVFGWTKNEEIARFDYDGRDQRFKTLPGNSLEVVGTLGPTSNVVRIQVTKPVSTNLVSFPLRVSVGTASGTTFPVALVLNDGAFGVPAVGTVELSRTTGNLNWNAGDLVTFDGQDVRFQRQTFFPFTDSNGRLGFIDAVLLLNPLPATTQYPLIRIGFGEYLTPVEVASDAGLVPLPATGSVKWSLITGRLAFNSGDVTANTGRLVYYDGVLMSGTAALIPVAVGTVTVPGVLSPLPPEESDTFFRVPGTVQFPETIFVDTLSTDGKLGRVEIRRSDGQVRFSKVDRDVYGATAVQAITADLGIERGMSLRLFRTPIDPAAENVDFKDVSALYATTDAILADPIIAAPQVFLPAVPVDTLLPLTVKVIDASGTETILDRMDVTPPPLPGIGYVLDYEQRTLLYAQRKVLQVVPAPIPYGAITLPDPLVFTTNLSLELETAPNSGLYGPLTLGEDALLDTTSGNVSLVQTFGELVTQGSLGAFSGTTFTDLGQSFIVAGVVSGDLLIVRNGASEGIYTVASVGGPTTLTTDLPGTTESNLVYEIRRNEEILADRFFKPVSQLDPNTKVERVLALGITTNAPRYSIPLSFASALKSRFRFGSSTFSTAVSTVANDGLFTAPASLPQSTVEISLTTGNLNFSSADVTAALTVYWVRTLTLGVDYQMQPPLGFIQFTDRFQELEEAILTYKNVSDLNTVITERAAFLVRKEVTQPHPIPTSTLFFNPLGREVATNPSARVFRGGRPQVNGEQVTINALTSTITFLSDAQITDALPHGASVGPTERVYIDYYVHQAIGGENSVTVIQPPMAGTLVLITAGTSSFTIAGDRTTDFLTNSMLRVIGDKQELYLIGSSSYNIGADATTVTLAAPQVFRSDVRNPRLFTTSGPTRVTSLFLLPSYFVTELTAFQTIPRGSNKIRFSGDLTGTYVKGRVIHLTNGATTFLDFYQVDGAVFNEVSGFTEVSLTATTYRQYNSTHILKRSVRPILEASTTVAQTSRTPVTSQSFTVFRRVSGEVGTILSQPAEFQIDDSGRVTFADPLQDEEAWVILYTGFTIAQAGQSLRASYTFQIVPSDTNGLLGATLLADYTTYAPDTVFWRVETFTNFRGELSVQYTQDAQASIPSGGPTLSNLSSPELHEQGRESLFFQEKHLANEDIVARTTTKFYNDAINYLEDVLQDMDGRVVGDRDGRLLFDGLIDNPDRTTFATVTNQIDDRLKISPAPYTVSFPPFSVTSIGTYREVYLPSKYSRFFPTRRRRYNVTVGPAGLEDGDSILDTQSKNLTSASKVQRRYPWAMLVRPAAVGDTTIYIDDVDGSATLLRPAFVATMKVKIADSATTYADPLTILAVGTGPHQITFTVALTGAIPAGASVFLSTSDTVYRKFYRVGTDVGLDPEDGQLTHIEPFPPLDGSVPAVPTALEVQNPAAGEVLDLLVSLNPTDVAPERFPALDGSTTDDDGDRQLPLLNPSLDSEAVSLGGVTLGYLETEIEIIQTGTGTLRLATTPSFIDAGGLDVLGTTLTGSAIFPASVKPYDLVRILTGANALSSFHQITTVVGSTLTVTPAFIPDAGFTFTVTASLSLVTSALGVIGPTTTLTDGSVNFLVSGVLPGHTVVITAGASIGERRQITVVTATILTVTPGFSFPGAVSYRVDNALGTFGGVPSIQTQLTTALSSELAILDTNTPPGPYSEREAIEQFYDVVFTDILTSLTGSVSIGSPTLTDISVDFVAAGITSEHFVFIRSGTVAGVYKVLAVTSTTTLDIETNFPATAAGVSYRIVSSTGATKESLQSLFSVLQGVDAFILGTTVFDTAVGTSVAVAPDVFAYATGLLTADLDTRGSLVSGRISDLSVSPTGSVVKVQAVLSSGDRFYDKRFIWISARIDRQTGILTKKARAVENRIEAQADILDQLTKLLTT